MKHFNYFEYSQEFTMKNFIQKASKLESNVFIFWFKLLIYIINFQFLKIEYFSLENSCLRAWLLM